MTRIAYQDALTKVKSKAAYDSCVEELTGRIEEGIAAFGIVMVDLNELKTINDTYGHENGDKYIIGACRTICLVYEHSPVYRVGGDEFVIVLEGMDYQNRDQLLQALRERFEQTSQDDERKPWARFSAAVGMAVYDSSIDLTVEEVLARADAQMYENKKAQKGEDPA